MSLEEDFIKQVRMAPGGYLVIGAINAAESAQGIRQLHVPEGFDTADCLERIAESLFATYLQEYGEA